jgi:hypothetical protein
MKTGSLSVFVILMVICVLAINNTLSAEEQKESLDSMAGHSFILKGYACRENTKINWNAISRQSGFADLGVSVLQVQQKNNKIQFKLENIGHVTDRTKKPQNSCPFTEINPITLTITEIPESITNEELLAGVEKILMTPDSYLGIKGFNVSQSTTDKNVLQPSPNADYPMAKTLVPRLCLNPRIPDEMHKGSKQEKVKVSVVIGLDGRVYFPKLIEYSSKEFARAMIRILPLCRYEPALEEGKPIVTKNIISLSVSVM